MKKLILTSLAAIGGMAFADQSSFVQAYDAGKFDEAARLIEGLDTTNAGVARRLGVMYYNAKGVEGDQTKGRALLEQAMLAGDATAAVNLAKIYFKIEKNSPKAAWCLMVAEGLKDASVKDDVAKLRGYLGEDYLKGVASYIAQLRDLLSSEQAALKNKTAETDRERTLLTTQITFCQEEAKKKEEAFAREREEFKSAKNDLGKKLAAAEEATAADKKKIKELNEKLAATGRDRLALEKLTAECEASKKTSAAREQELEMVKKELEEAGAESKRLGVELETANKSYKTILDKYNTLVANSNQKVSNSENAVAEAKKEAEEANQEYEEMLTKYNKLVDKYNDLVKKYNSMLKLYKRSSAMVSPIDYFGGDLEDDATEVAETSKAPKKESEYSVGDGIGRGWNTFWCAPCNLVRVGPATKSVYDTTTRNTNGAYGFFVSAISAPVILCCEAVPIVCDLGNGFVDMLTLGAYGNWLYSDSLTSMWWKRNDEHFFPWIDRDK